jgi:hypothetical protein
MDLIDDETYIYIGHHKNTFFFIHNTSNLAYNDKITNEIYCYLIDNGTIDNNNQNVIVFEKDNDVECNKIITIQNKNKNYLDKFEENNLRMFYKQLIKQLRNDIYVIRYSYLHP